MKIRNKINQEVIVAATSLLANFIPELTPTKLIAALETFESEAQTTKQRPESPYTITEACKLLQVSKPTIYKMFLDGTLTRIKVRNSTRIPASEIHSIIN